MVSPTTSPTIKVNDLRKSYEGVPALDGVSFEVHRGEIFGLLGANGAGKTTALEIIEGYRRGDAGRVEVLGVDPVHGGTRFRERIGVMLQEGGLYPGIKPEELLRLFASYYPDSRDPNELLSLVGLDDVRRTVVRRMSGGERQRLSLALALVGNPELVFLDEPTAGIDPRGRQHMWDVVRGLGASGVTVMLTTHAMDEAEALCSRVAIIDHGRLVALDTPAALRQMSVAQVTRFSAPPGLDVMMLSGALGLDGTAVREVGPGEYVIECSATPELIAGLASWLLERGVTLGDLRSGPSFEEVFLSLTEPEQM